MKLNRIRCVFFSPAGNTAKVAAAAAEGAASALGLPWEPLDLTLPADREGRYGFRPDELVIVGVPTYAGKTPNKLLPFLQSGLAGGGALCAAVVTFGNRSYDNALAELCAALEGDGFHTLSAAAFACRHAFTDALAAGRPDGADLAQARALGEETARRAAALTATPAPAAVPGDADAPYYIPRGLDGEPAKFLKAKPKTDAGKCTRCGLCAARCPMGAIDPADVFETPGVCVKCQRCVRSCPAGAKFFDDPAFLSHVAMLEASFGAVQENEVFL